MQLNGAPPPLPFEEKEAEELLPICYFDLSNPTTYPLASTCWLNLSHASNLKTVQKRSNYLVFYRKGRTNLSVRTQFFPLFSLNYHHMTSSFIW